MSEQETEEYVKIEIEVPVSVKRFLEALEELTGRNVDQYLTGVLLQGLVDGLNPDA